MVDALSPRTQRDKGTEWEYLDELDAMAEWLYQGDEASPALIAATESLDTFRGASSVRVWIHNVVSSRVQRARPDRASRDDDLDRYLDQRVALSSSHGRYAGPSTHNPMTMRMQIGARMQVLEDLCRLPDNYRCALLLKEGANLSVSGTASLMKVSEGSLRSILYRARQNFRS